MQQIEKKRITFCSTVKLSIRLLAFFQAVVHAGLKLGMTRGSEETAGGDRGSVAGCIPLKALN